MEDTLESWLDSHGFVLGLRREGEVNRGRSWIWDLRSFGALSLMGFTAR